jgi:hypothetical protein
VGSHRPFVHFLPRVRPEVPRVCPVLLLASAEDAVYCRLLPFNRTNVVGCGLQGSNP